MCQINANEGWWGRWWILGGDKQGFYTVKLTVSNETADCFPSCYWSLNYCTTLACSLSSGSYTTQIIVCEIVYETNIVWAIGFHHPGGQLSLTYCLKLKSYVLLILPTSLSTLFSTSALYWDSSPFNLTTCPHAHPLHLVLLSIPLSTYCQLLHVTVLPINLCFHPLHVHSLSH